MGKVHCVKCHKKCSGEVLKVQNQHFHIHCFKCKVCDKSLSQSGFFLKDGDYYCTADYRDKFGVRCVKCGEYIEGEVVTAMGSTFHHKCFLCQRCRQPFVSGAKVTFAGDEVFCQQCVSSSSSSSPQQQQQPLPQGVVSSAATDRLLSSSPHEGCAGCGEELKEGQALVALDRQWHVTCFKCKACGTLLHGEYMGKDGQPYCERDYQNQFGVRCNYCERYISGKVLQAGDRHHFHPTCARCTKCGDPFGDGEEMFLQGTAIWHPRCGPRPGGAFGSALYNGHASADLLADGFSSSAASDTQSLPYSPVGSASPGSVRRKCPRPRSPAPPAGPDATRLYTCSYLTGEPATYLRRPIHPYDKPPRSPQFHRPQQRRSRSATPSSRSATPGMRRLVETIASESPRPRSPHMNNEEPIELAHYPGARPPDPKQPPKIERDDFPAPPFPYTDPERRRRWSGSQKRSDGEDDSEGDEVDLCPRSSDQPHHDSSGSDPKLKRKEEELLKASSGIGRAFLQDLKEHEKLRQWRLHHLDPRNSSRTPSADRELRLRLRYLSPINASPSRYVDHPRPSDDEDFDRSSSYRSSVGRSIGAIPSYHVKSSLRPALRPGYGLKAATLPASGRDLSAVDGLTGDFAATLSDKAHSGGDLSTTTATTTHSETSSMTDERQMLLMMRPSSTFSGGLSCGPQKSSIRRSLPSVAPPPGNPKLYPLHLLLTTNYRLPADVDRTNLECHLADEEFEGVFHMTRSQFYRLPLWKRNELKRRARLY